jgi:Glycosyl transferase family 8
MATAKNYIVFQCYGNEQIYMECVFALLSLSKLYRNRPQPDFNIWIYTDQPEWFGRFADCPFHLNFRRITPAELQVWRGNHFFVHRVKIEILLDFLPQHSGNVLYTDTDITFLQPLEPLFAMIAAGELVMHVAEGYISNEHNPVLHKLQRFLRANERFVLPASDGCQPVMWNAGVLGFNTEYTPIVRQVLDFTDAMYPRYAKHITEQYAFSVHFRKERTVKTAAPYILHYWNLKEMRSVLHSFFTYFSQVKWVDLEYYCTLISPPVLLQEKANFYHNRSVSGKILKKKWSPAVFNWAESTRQL